MNSLTQTLGCVSLMAALTMPVGLASCGPRQAVLRPPPDSQASSRPSGSVGPAGSAAPANGASRVTIVVDIDDTISITDYARLFRPRDEGPEPYEQAKEVLTELSREFDIVYLTARPLWLFSETSSWLRKHGFPSGPVLTTNQVVDALRPRAFKTRLLAILRERSPEILIGIGDRSTDVQAYAANRMLCLVVNPRPATVYAKQAIILKDWGEVGRFFREQWEVLANPASLRQRFEVGGPSPDPRTIQMRVNADLNLFLKLPLVVPALLIEPLVKADLIFEQADAREALRRVELPFDAMLAEAIGRYGEKNLLKIRLGMHRGRPTYYVWASQNGKPRRARIDGVSGEHSGLKEILDSKSNSLATRPQASITFAEAMEVASKEVTGDVYEVELEMDDDEPTYEVAIMTMERFIEVEVHAVSGEILEVENETAMRY